jgi:tape measure domain-containing protein
MTLLDYFIKIAFDVDDKDLAKASKSIDTLKSNVSDSLNRVNRGVGQIGQGISQITTPISAGLALVSGFSLKTYADIEQINMAYEVMLGSVEKGKKLTKDLIDFASKTPFEIKGIQSSAKQLLGMGFELEEIIPSLKAVGDVSAGVGAPLERLILNLGQVRTRGKLTGQELRDFAVNGVPLIEELAKQFGVAKEEIAGMVSKGQISFEDTMKAFTNMTSEGGKFNNMMFRLSGTLGGRFSNFLDNITKMMIDFGESLDKAFDIRGKLNKANEFLESIQKKFNDLSDTEKRFGFVKLALLALIPIVTLFASTFGSGLLKIGKGMYNVSSGILRLGLNITRYPVVAFKKLRAEALANKRAMSLYGTTAKTSINLTGIALKGLTFGLKVAKIAAKLFWGAMTFGVGLVALEAISLLIEDVIVWLDGGESAFGDFYQKIVDGAKTAFGFLKGFYTGMIDFFIGMIAKPLETLQKVYSKVAGVLGLPEMGDIKASITSAFATPSIPSGIAVGGMGGAVITNMGGLTINTAPGTSDEQAKEIMQKVSTSLGQEVKRVNRVKEND